MYHRRQILQMRSLNETDRWHVLVCISLPLRQLTVHTLRVINSVNPFRFRFARVCIL